MPKKEQIIPKVDAGHLFPFTMDRIINFGLLCKLDFGHHKTVSKAIQMPTDTADIDVSNAQSDLDVLVDILGSTHELEDRALVNSALACMRCRVYDGLLGVTEWVVAIKRACEMKTVKTAHDDMQNRVLLTAGLYHRSALELPWPYLAKDIFEAALKVHEDLQDYWTNTKYRYDMIGRHQYPA